MDTIQLPSLDQPADIDPVQAEEFRTNGHLLTRKLLSTDEVAAYRQVINDAAYTHNTEKRSLEERDTYGKAFLQVMNLWEVDDGVKKFTLAKRFASVAAALLGVERVRLYHDQA